MEIDELTARLDSVDAAASLALGRTKALEYGVRFLIATHPNPEGAERAWQKLLVLIADEHLETSSAIPDAQMYQAGMQDLLALLTRQMELRRRPP